MQICWENERETEKKRGERNREKERRDKQAEREEREIERKRERENILVNTRKLKTFPSVFF